MKKNIGLFGEIQEELRKARRGETPFSRTCCRERRRRRKGRRTSFWRHRRERGKSRSRNHPAADRNGAGSLTGDGDCGEY